MIIIFGALMFWLMKTIFGPLSWGVYAMQWSIIKICERRKHCVCTLCVWFSHSRRDSNPWSPPWEGGVLSQLDDESTNCIFGLYSVLYTPSRNRTYITSLEGWCSIHWTMGADMDYPRSSFGMWDFFDGGPYPAKDGVTPGQWQ